MKKKNVSCLAVIVLAISTMMLGGCGKEKTLEDHVNKNPTLQDEVAFVQDMFGEELDFEIKGNEVIYTITVDEELSEEDMAQAGETMDQMLTAMEPTVKDTIEQMEEEVKVDGITMTMKYVTGEGEEIYSHVFEN